MKRLPIFFLATALVAGAAEAGFFSDKLRAGCPVVIDKASDGDVVAAGCEVRVNAPVDGKVRIAGGDVEIGPDANVTGNVALAGGDVVVKGHIKGNLSAAGGNVRIDGKVDGDASVAAGNFELGPNAKIGGKLRYRAGNFERADEAEVASGIERASRHRWNRHVDSFDGFGHSSPGWIWTAGLMILAGAIAALLPGFSGRMSDEMRAHPWTSLLFGFIAFVCIPVAAVLLMVTVIGIPIGLLAIVGYAALLLVGYVVTSVVVGGLLLDRIQSEAAKNVGWRALAAVGAMLAIAIVGRIPVLGHLVVFAALLVGVGAIVAIGVRPWFSPLPGSGSDPGSSTA
jgi:hypothetical protein